MVRSWTGWKRLSVNCSSRHDFPTPANTEQTTDRTVNHRPRAYLWSSMAPERRMRIPSSPPLALGARTAGGQAERGEGIGAAEAADSGGGRGRGGARRTCVADDDVLEEVGIRHPRRIGSDRPVPARRWRCFPGREEKRRRVPEDSTRFDSIRDAVGLGVMKQRRVWDSRAVGWGVGCTCGGRTVQREGSENVTDAEANQDSNSNGASLAGAGWACPNKGARLRG
jgi:hypothetical protein